MGAYIAQARSQPAIIARAIMLHPVKPTSKRTLAPTPEPIAEPTSEPTPELIAEPTPEETPEPIAEPTADPGKTKARPPSVPPLAEMRRAWKIRRLLTCEDFDDEGP